MVSFVALLSCGIVDVLPGLSLYVVSASALGGAEFPPAVAIDLLCRPKRKRAQIMAVLPGMAMASVASI